MNKAEEICSGVHVLHDEAVSLAESVLEMSKKLNELNKQLPHEPLIIEYDNGGGQSGVRENPFFVAYEHLMASYNKSLRQLTEIVNKGTPYHKANSIMSELTVIAGKKVK